MKYYGVTLDQVLTATADFNQNSAGGVLHCRWGNEYIVRGVVATDRTDDMARAVVKTVEGTTGNTGPDSRGAYRRKAPLLGLASERAIRRC